MGIEHLKSVLVLRQDPIEVPSAEDWQQFERENMRLPSDYRGFLSFYGSGYVLNLEVFNPFARGRLNEWTRFVDAVIEYDRRLRDEDPFFREGYGYWSIWPEPGGHLPFGCDLGGQVDYWRTVG